MKHWFSDLNAFRRDPLQFLLSRGASATDALVPLALGPFPVLLVADPDLVKPLMKETEDRIDKGRLIHKLRAIVGKSSLTISGERHRERRVAIHQQLARGIATSYVPQIAAVVRQFAAQACREKAIDAHAETAPLALRIIANALFGNGVLSEADQAALIHAVKLVEDDLAAGMFDVLPPGPLTWYRRRRHLRLARDIMSGIVERTRQRASASSLLHALEQLNLSDEEIRDEVLMILLAGHHTTGTAAAWVLYHLAADESLCARVAAEAVAVTNADGEVIASQLTHASVSQSVVREVLRLYPSAWWFSREVKRPIEIAGRTVKHGTSLLISPWALQRDPRFWETPDLFDETRPATNRAYFPFGAGPRACVGMGMAMLELQILALEIAAAFTLAVTSEVPPPAPRPSITLIPPSIRISFAPRERMVSSDGDCGSTEKIRRAAAGGR